MNNTFFSGNASAWNITFTARLRTFIKDNKYGYYIDIYVPENKVTALMKSNIPVKYFDEGIDSGFVIRCRVRNDSIIVLNGRKLTYLSEELSNQSRVTASNTKVKSLELYPYAASTRKNTDAQCCIIRATFKTESQKLPKGF